MKNILIKQNRSLIIAHILMSNHLLEICKKASTDIPLLNISCKALVKVANKCKNYQEGEYHLDISGICHFLSNGLQSQFLSLFNSAIQK